MSNYEKLINDLANLDWYYDYSDNHNTWIKGRNAMMEVIAQLSELPYEDAKSLWNQYSPADYNKHKNLEVLLEYHSRTRAV